MADFLQVLTLFANLNKLAFGNQQFYRSLLWLKILLIFACSLLTFSAPATALLRQHRATPDLWRYHAQDSLQDRDGNAWQVLLFPENAPNSAYYLRLVGFPGVNSFIHPQSLEILTEEGRIFAAADAYEEAAPTPNVGQYDLTPIIPKIDSVKSLQLSVPLQDNCKLVLKIEPEVLSEWHLLTQEIEPTP
ncbi:MAG: DUF3122 domain-containing protein [Cyanobacteria bacterium J06621_8]